MAVIAEKLTEKLEENHNAENVFFPLLNDKILCPDLPIIAMNGDAFQALLSMKLIPNNH